MATFLKESYFDGKNGSHFKQSLYYDISQSIANNTSTITYYGYVGSVDGYSGSGGTATVYINGDSVGTFTSLSSYSSDTLRGTKTVTINHNADGTATASYSMSTDTPWTLGDSSLSGSFTLPTIPRQATLKSAQDFNDEGNPTITYTNPAGNAVSSLVAGIYNSSGSVAYASYRNVSKTGSSYTFNLTDDERNALRNATPNSNSMTVRFYLRTTIGGSNYYSSIQKTMTIVNGNPVFNDFLFEDINPVTLALTGNNQYNINGYSTIQATIPVINKAEALKNATMSKYRFTIGDSSVDIPYSGEEDVSGVINNATSGTYNVYAIDSRNNSKLVTKLADNVINYESLYINKTTSNIVRDNNQVGTNAILTLNGTFWNDTFGQVTNTIKSISYKLKKTTSSTWIDGTTPINLTISNNTFTFSGNIASDNQDTTWDLQDSYDIQVIIEDELSTSTISLILPSAIPTLCLDKEGVGIMGKYDRTIGGYLQIQGKKIIDFDSIYPVGSIYLTVSDENPSDLFGGTWEKMTGGYLYACVNAIENSSYKGTGTQSHTLTAAQSGLPGHGHTGKGWADVNDGSGSYRVLGAQGVSQDYSVNSTGGWNASQGHSHNVAYIGVWCWKRTA